MPTDTAAAAAVAVATTVLADTSTVSTTPGHNSASDRPVHPDSPALRSDIARWTSAEPVPVEGRDEAERMRQAAITGGQRARALFAALDATYADCKARAAARALHPSNGPSR